MDSSITSIVNSMEKLNSTNYTLWSDKIKNLLEICDLWSTLDSPSKDVYRIKKSQGPFYLIVSNYCRRPSPGK